VTSVINNMTIAVPSAENSPVSPPQNLRIVSK
jgi:hypothetical protein